MPTSRTRAGTTSKLPVDAEGTVQVPAYALPLSAALTDRSRASMATILSRTTGTTILKADDFASEADFKVMVDGFRSNVDRVFAPEMSSRLLEALPVNITGGELRGVRVEEFTPLSYTDTERVIINLHGGGFYSGATYISRIESIPMANLGRFRVISVDYRQGYEHKFPAASEDVCAVYEQLLKCFAPTQIGIYGSSAGAVLTAQATAWILQRGLPAPGAIGMLGAYMGGQGDSAYFGAIGIGLKPPFPFLGRVAGASVGYFSNADDTDPLVNPCIAPASFLARFPPTLLITATRAFDMSAAIATHRALLQAEVDASLHVFDGLGHCFHYDATAPEGADAYQTMVRFFRKHLRAG